MKPKRNERGHIIANRLADVLTWFIVRPPSTLSTGCWEWTGRIDKDGYGKASLRKAVGREWMAHRLFYTRYRGPIPAQCHLHHRCFNPRCVNAYHLDILTKSEHALQARHAASLWATRTHCQKGHPYAGENLKIGPNGWRRCRTCTLESSRRSKRNQPGKAIPHNLKTHCPSGHPYSGENLLLTSRPDGGIGRQCKECNRRRARDRYKSKRRLV